MAASLAGKQNAFYTLLEAAANSTEGINSANSSKSSMHAKSPGMENTFMRKAFRRVNNGNSAGADDFLVRVQRACTDQLTLVFTEIFNLSLEQPTINIVL